MNIFEGGNVFKDGDGRALTQRINQTDVKPTLAWLDLMLPGLDLQNNTLGSTGLKPTSGDLDVAVDANRVTKEQLTTRLGQWVQSHGFKPEDYVKKTGTAVHFKTPIVGNPANGYVQTDFMFLKNVPWSKFVLTAPANSEYKGVDRNVLMNSIAKSMGYKLNQIAGIADRATNQVVTDDPDKVAKLLLNKSATRDDLYSVETIIQALATDRERAVGRVRLDQGRVVEVRVGEPHEDRQGRRAHVPGGVRAVLLREREEERREVRVHDRAGRAGEHGRVRARGLEQAGRRVVGAGAHGDVGVELDGEVLVDPAEHHLLAPDVGVEEHLRGALVGVVLARVQDDVLERRLGLLRPGARLCRVRDRGVRGLVGQVHLRVAAQGEVRATLDERGDVAVLLDQRAVDRFRDHVAAVGVRQGYQGRARLLRSVANPGAVGVRHVGVGLLLAAGSAADGVAVLRDVARLFEGVVAGGHAELVELVELAGDLHEGVTLFGRDPVALGREFGTGGAELLGLGVQLAIVERHG